ncbi:MAG: hypothetical protein ABIR96_00660 [Bdellovibrionota bacterium]
MKLTRFSYFVLAFGSALALPCAARDSGIVSGPTLVDEDATLLRLNVGVGVTYEFQNLDGVFLTGAGPTAEMSLEFIVAKRRSWGFGARYRRISLLGPEVSSTGATIEKLSNIDYTAYARFGWLDIFAGAEQFYGKMYVVNSGSAGSTYTDSQLMPVGGLGMLLYSTKRLKCRAQAIYSAGTAYGYAVASFRANASMTIAFP